MQYKFNFFITKLGDWWDHDFCLVSEAAKWCGVRSGLYLSATLTVTLSAASGMQSGSEEQREGGRGGPKRDKCVNLVYGFGMTKSTLSAFF